LFELGSHLTGVQMTLTWLIKDLKNRALVV